jgi:hypothetical protein
VAHDAGIDTDGFGAVRDWLDRVREAPGFMNDLDPYPAHAGPGGASVHG